MTLPALDPDGLLPPGRHPATLEELWERFVEKAPHRHERERAFTALRLELESLRRLGGASNVWIDGGFVTHKTWAAPKDVDIVYWCHDRDHLAKMLGEEGVMQVLTVQGAAIWKPVSVGVSRLQPMGGLVDAFLATPSRERVAYWDAVWSSVKGPDGEIIEGAVKGYVEVVL